MRFSEPVLAFCKFGFGLFEELPLGPPDTAALVSAWDNRKNNHSVMTIYDLKRCNRNNGNIQDNSSRVQTAKNGAFVFAVPPGSLSLGSPLDGFGDEVVLVHRSDLRLSNIPELTYPQPLNPFFGDWTQV